MRKATIILVILLTHSLACLAGDVLYIPEKATFAAGVDVRDGIKTECQLEQFMADDTAAAVVAAKLYKSVVREKPSGNYDILEMEITNVFGPGGGGWSGAKNLNIRGTLKDSSGKSLGSFTAGRFSTGGAFSGFKGTCKILRRITKVLGKDVARFLESPAEGVKMGN